MPVVTLPDGTEKPFPEPVTGLAVADSIGPRLAKDAVAIRVDGSLNDLTVTVDHDVSVEILTFEPIFVLGEVNKPGSYAYAPGLTMLKAIALAGGYTNRARTNALYLIRRDSEEKEQTIRSNKPVMPGDTIFVKERWF